MKPRKPFLLTESRRTASVVCGVIALLTAALATSGFAGLRVNDTVSMPRGIWQISKVEAPLRHGQIVIVCPPDTASIREAVVRHYISTGNCPGGYEPLVKPVAAVAGDMVTVTPEGIAVNGRLIGNTAQRAQDYAGRPLQSVPAGAYPVLQGQVWLLSGYSGRSFDSRYLGPIPATNVQGVARPLWVLG
jgi:conjugative transfer signal peptidase TraF